MLDKEIWKASPVSTTFEVSSLGRVRNVQTGRTLKGAPGRKGYLYVCLSLGSAGCVTKAVHILVARAFLGDPPPGKQVNHVDGIKTNNAVGNLEYLTTQENIAHAVRLGLTCSGSRNRATTHPESVPRGEDVRLAKLKNKQVVELRNRYAAGGVSQRRLGAEYGVSCNTIKQIVKGRIWKHLL